MLKEKKQDNFMTKYNTHVHQIVVPPLIGYVGPSLPMIPANMMLPPTRYGNR